jgi:hypothetical protein
VVTGKIVKTNDLVVLGENAGQTSSVLQLLLSISIVVATTELMRKAQSIDCKWVEQNGGLTALVRA